jgi:hypothetical protein
MLPQPPPDVEAPLPSEPAIRSQRKWKWLLGIGIVSIMICLLLLAAPLFMRNRRTGCDPSETVSNARLIGLALFEFDTEYGKFPDETTISKVREATGTDLNLGTKTSNDFFRQLIGSGIAQSESMFYAKIAGTRKPDGDFTGKKALEKGEVGFAYFSGLSSEGNPSKPLVITPLIPGTDRFDPKPFKGKAVILKADNSVTSMTIGKDGRVMMDGRNLLDPDHPVWGGQKWKLVWPE